MVDGVACQDAVGATSNNHPSAEGGCCLPNITIPDKTTCFQASRMCVCLYVCVCFRAFEKSGWLQKRGVCKRLMFTKRLYV